MELRQANDEFKDATNAISMNKIIRSILGEGYSQAVSRREGINVTLPIHDQIRRKQVYPSQVLVKERCPRDANNQSLYKHFLAQKDDHYIWLVLNGLGELMHHWELDMSNPTATDFDFVSNCTLSLGDEHWLAAVFVARDRNSVGISVFCKGRPLHYIHQDSPRVSYYDAINIQLHEAWGEVYLVLGLENIDGKYSSKENRLILYKLGQTGPYQTVKEFGCSDKIRVDRSNPFPRSRKDETILFSCLERDGSVYAEPPRTWLWNLVVKSDGTVCATGGEWIEHGFLPYENETYEVGDALILGTGSTFLALLLRPQLERRQVALAFDKDDIPEPSDFRDPFDESEFNPEFFRDELLKGTPAFVMLMVYDADRWLQPEILEEGLGVEHFVSCSPWLAIDGALYKPPPLS